jgi:hypothetical protein
LPLLACGNVDKADALPTFPQAQQRQKGVANRILAA